MSSPEIRALAEGILSEGKSYVYVIEKRGNVYALIPGDHGDDPRVRGEMAIDHVADPNRGIEAAKRWFKRYRRSGKIIVAHSRGATDQEIPVTRGV